MGIVLTILKLLIVLGIVTIIHELGHFLVAKLCKMKVDEFAIGFGKPIFKRERNGTKYSLRWLPLGGFCAIDGEEGASDDNNAFYKKPKWQRILVLLAGATFNAILAIIIFLSINMFFDTGSTKVTELAPGSSVEQAGIQVGDTITHINGKKVNIVQDIVNYNNTDEDNIIVKYERDDKAYETLLNDVVKEIGYMGVYFKQNAEGTVTNEIDVVEGGGAAKDAGLKAGDKIIGIGELETTLGAQVIQQTQLNPGNTIDIKLERNGKIVETTVTPNTKQIVSLGIVSTEVVSTNLFYSWCKSVSNIKQIGGSYVDLFRGKVKVTQLSGIVGIGEVVSKTEGVPEFINLIAIISLAVGLANVMPFPPLDGGKIVIVLVEAVTRKRVSPKVEAILSYIGIGLLIALTIYVTYNDITRIF